MRCDMPDDTFYLQDASDYLVSIGAADELLCHDSSSSNIPSEPETTLLQHHYPAQLRGGSRSRGPLGRRFSHLNGPQ